jgi:IS30 family transposase
VTKENRPLTDREQSVIDLYQSGKTLRQIAAEVGVSHQTVHTLLRKSHVRAVLNDRVSNTIQRALERAAKDLPALLSLEAEIAQSVSDAKADAVRLKAIQGRIARHVALVTPIHAEPDEATGDQDEAVLAGLERIKATRPDLLAAARLKADE